MGQYAICSEDINEIEEQLHNTDDQFHDWRELDNLGYISLSKGVYGTAL